jgi:hypothetical protein
MSSYTTATPISKPAHIPNRKLDRIFFSFMALAILASVLYGFAKTYFLAGMVAAPLPNKLIHIHGAAFTLWILLFIVQTALVSTHNIRIHKKLGIFGFLLAIAMIGLGFAAAIDQLHRASGPPTLDPQTFFIIPIQALLLFGLFIGLAYRARFRPEAHKRLILIGTLSILDAAIGRWPIPYLQQHPPAQDFVLFAFLLALVLFDLISLHRVSKTTLWASAVFIVVNIAKVPIGLTPAWHHFAQLCAKL